MSSVGVKTQTSFVKVYDRVKYLWEAHTPDNEDRSQAAKTGLSNFSLGFLAVVPKGKTCQFPRGCIKMKQQTYRHLPNKTDM